MNTDNGKDLVWLDEQIRKGIQGCLEYEGNNIITILSKYKLEQIIIDGFISINCDDFGMKPKLVIEIPLPNTKEYDELEIDALMNESIYKCSHV